ncbi:MAG: hypothetical protein NTV81_02180 [Candidatus Komeilibacteria bacterium]|nr:hypothetical protein [Candidatus Komeilibacteria bacterium]
MFHKRNLALYFAKNILVIVGVVLIWRGIWYILDGLDILLFGHGHVWSSIIGIIVGLLLIYLPDHDLKEIGKL